MKLKFFISITTVICFFDCRAQDSSKLYFNTGVGVVKVNPALHHVLKPAVAFNSGLELNLRKNWFAQATIDFNTLRYDQHIKDDQSTLLFTNTNSFLLLLGINAGKNFPLSRTWFLSGYAGSGFLSIGEPRITVMNDTARQEVRRSNSVFGRLGWRVGHRTKIKFLETIYVDASWWGSTLTIQQYRLTGFAFSLGTRMGVSK